MRIIIASAIVAAFSSNAMAQSKSDFFSSTELLMKNQRFERAVESYRNCKWDIDILDCHRDLLMSISGYIQKKDYKSALKYLPVFYREMSGVKYYAEKVCPTVTAYDGDRNYEIGYYQTAYRIYDGMGSSKKRDFIFRAFQCANFQSANYAVFLGKNEFSHFSKDKFIKSFSKEFGGDQSYSVDMYLAEIVSPLFDAMKKASSQKDYRIAYSTIFRNAAKHCKKIGLDNRFCEFYIDLSKEYIRYAKENEK